MYGTSMCENREIPRSPVRLITGRDVQGTRGGTPEMHEGGKSDGPVVPANLPNKAVGAVAEAGEGRGSAKGNTASKTPAVNGTRGSAWARVATVLGTAGLATAAVLQAVDGVALKSVVDLWSDAAQERA